MHAALERPPKSPGLNVIAGSPGSPRTQQEGSTARARPLLPGGEICFPCEKESEVPLSGFHSPAGETGAREGEGRAPEELVLNMAGVGVQNESPKTCLCGMQVVWS